MKYIAEREFTSKERAEVKKCTFCMHQFGDAHMPAIEFELNEGCSYIPVEFQVIKILGQRTFAPYECYKVTPTIVNIADLIVKQYELDGTTVFRIALKIPKQ